MKKAAAENTHPAALLADANAALGPLFDQGAKKLAPFASAAREGGQKAAVHAREAMAPALETAREKYLELLPKLGDALDEVSSNPRAKDAQFRLLAARAALNGELELPRKARKKIEKLQKAQIKKLKGANKPSGKTPVGLIVLLTLSVVGIVGYVLWKKVVGSNDAEWQTYEPAHAAGVKDSTSQTFGEPVNVPTAESDTQAEESSKYGAGSYVGAEPPAGYTIKGNDRSKKYHTPDTGGYERTIADVWFVDEKSAEAAGFTKAQR